MKSIYFLPTTGVEKFDEINDKIISALTPIIEVKSFPLRKITNYYPANFKDEIPALIFIPTIFDYRNALSYEGVDFALRWYFYFISTKDQNNFGIVLLGTEDKAAFFQHCNYSNFIKCPSVYYLQNNYEEINQFISGLKLKGIDRKEALQKIEQIGIIPPASYKTHHSIANEWAILRWANALKLETKEIERIEHSIESILYYNYLKTRYQIIENSGIATCDLKNKGKILFIDDEIDKGWESIFKKIAEKIPEYDICFMGRDFKKNKNPKQIESIVLKEVENFDVIVLDLRLHEDDFSEGKSINDITGFKILQKIKGYYDQENKLVIPAINKGIQVIIFSASNKIWNLQALVEAGADGFIIKESPENSIDENFTVQSIMSIYKTLDDCLDMSFLKNIDIQMQVVKNTIKSQRKNVLSKDLSEFYDRTIINLDIAFDLLKKSRISIKYRNYGFLHLFQIIEDFVKLNEIFIEGDSCYVHCKQNQILVLNVKHPQTNAPKYHCALKYIEENKKYIIQASEFNRRIDTNFKVSCLLLFRFGFDSSNKLNWNTINYCRNTKAAHGGEKGNIFIEEIYKLLDFLNFLIADRNQNEKNIQRGLVKNESQK